MAQGRSSVPLLMESDAVGNFSPCHRQTSVLSSCSVPEVAQGQPDTDVALQVEGNLLPKNPKP